MKGRRQHRLGNIGVSVKKESNGRGRDRGEERSGVSGATTGFLKAFQKAQSIISNTETSKPAFN